MEHLGGIGCDKANGFRGYASSHQAPDVRQRSTGLALIATGVASILAWTLLTLASRCIHQQQRPQHIIRIITCLCATSSLSLQCSFIAA